MKTHLLDFNITELKGKLPNWSGQDYRFRQLCDWIFGQRASSFEQMSNLPQSFRNELAHEFSLRGVQVSRRDHSHDGTTKLTFETHDHEFFSAVFLPHGTYNSLCISTQVGCAWKCRFCASGLVPFRRNLSSGEILDQIFLSEEVKKEKIHNVLFMGMGEPLANYDGTVKTIRWLTSPEGFGMSPSRITLSTTGVVPQIKKIADERLNVNLALSLHAASDKIRKKIMPVSSRYSIDDVLAACKVYQKKNDSDFTIEYILLRGVNDGLKDAEHLADLLISMNFSTLPKINLIPYNPVPSLPYDPPDPARVRSFFNILKRKRLIVHTRKPRGQDIDAACGQLL